jgi:single-stranded-DNA-specific exonuclease
MQGTAPRPTLKGDLEVGLDTLSDELEHFLQYLGPFGMGNARPVFFSHGVRLSGSAREVGKGHLKFQLAGADRKIEAIGFNMFGRVSTATLDRGPVDIAYQLTINEFRGRRTLQARLKDVRPHQGAQS